MRFNNQGRRGTENDMGITLKAMTPDDYDQVYELWESIHGFAIRSIDDSRKGVERFLERNPGVSVVAVYEDEAAENSRIVGSILCGHDGRTASFYHVCVAEEFRRHGIGKDMVVFCMNALMERSINTISLVAFHDNIPGNSFWNGIGWTMRSDLNQYEFKLNKENIIAFTQ